MQTNRTQQHWLDLIQQQPQSGLNIQDFCRQNQLATSTFYKYRKTLAAKSSFTKVSVNYEQTIAQASVQPETIVLVLPIGELQLPVSTSPAYLARLIKGLLAKSHKTATPKNNKLQKLKINEHTFFHSGLIFYRWLALLIYSRL